MRESFVFHKDYIEDLPDQYKPEFIQATINYGLYGTKPPFKNGTLELALWSKIARRIDAETEKYREISAKRKEAAQKRYQQYQQRAGCAWETEQKQEETERKTVDTEQKKEPTEQAAESPKTARFVKPTVEEVEAYCNERKNGLDARAFFDFYESKGWKVGASKMKDWRASVRTWEQRRKTEQTGGRRKAGAIWGNENEIPEEIMNLL